MGRPPIFGVEATNEVMFGHTRVYTRVSISLNYSLKILQRIDPVIKLPFDLNDGKNYPPGLNTNRV